MRYAAALHDFREAFAAANPAGEPVVVTPETIGDSEHAEAVREFQRSLRGCSPANPAPEEV